MIDFISDQMTEKKQQNNPEEKKKKLEDGDQWTAVEVKQFSVVDNSHFIALLRKLREQDERGQKLTGKYLASIEEILFKLDALNNKFDMLVDFIALNAAEFEGFIKEKEEEIKKEMKKNMEDPETPDSGDNAGSSAPTTPVSIPAEFSADYPPPDQDGW